MSALAIPDPRNQPVPLGWAEAYAAPAIFGTDDWDRLDEYEARLRAFASYIDAYEGDVVEFEKALRMLEKRRGDLLIAGTTRGTDDSKQTATRWRKIASHWDELWPLIRDTRNRRDVTQAALLRRIENSDGAVIVPYELVTPRKRQIAESRKRRLWSVLSIAAGSAGSLDEVFDLDSINVVAAVTTYDDLGDMAKSAKENARAYRDLAKRIETVMRISGARS